MRGREEERKGKGKERGYVERQWKGVEGGEEGREKESEGVRGKGNLLHEGDRRPCASQVSAASVRGDAFLVHQRQFCHRCLFQQLTTCPCA